MTKNLVRMKNKTYHVRYTVQARNVVEAMEIAKKRKPDDVYTTDEESNIGTHAIGFSADIPEDDWE